MHIIASLTRRTAGSRALLAGTLILATLTSAIAISVESAPRAAFAAEISGAITAISISPTTVANGEGTTVNLNWSVPNGSKSGDTFTLGLPPEFMAMTDGFELRDAQGNLVAVATVSSGVVTFTLTDFVNSHTAVHGTAFFGATFTTSAPSGTTVTTNFTANGTVVPVPVEVGGSPGTQPGEFPFKEGSWADPASQGTDPHHAIAWKATTEAGPWTSATIVDTLGAGQSLDCSTLTATTLAVPDFTTETPLDPTRLTISNCTSAGFTAVVTDTPAGQAIRFSYEIDITDSSLASYKNDLAVTADNTTLTAGGTVKRFDAGGDGSGTTPTTPPNRPTNPPAQPSTPPDQPNAPITSTSTLPIVAG